LYEDRWISSAGSVVWCDERVAVPARASDERRSEDRDHGSACGEDKQAATTIGTKRKDAKLIDAIATRTRTTVRAAEPDTVPEQT